MRIVGSLVMLTLVAGCLGSTGPSDSREQVVADEGATFTQDVTLNGWATPIYHSYADAWNCIQFSTPLRSIEATAIWSGGPDRLRLAVQQAGNGDFLADAVGTAGVKLNHAFPEPTQYARLFVVLPREQVREEAVHQSVSLSFTVEANEAVQWETQGICT